jgi:hypothetical protein
VLKAGLFGAIAADMRSLHVPLHPELIRLRDSILAAGGDKSPS